MLVKATEMSSKLKVRIKELHRIVNEGEIFDVSPMRFEVLSGKNKFKAVFVKEVVDENVIIVDDLLKEEDQKEQTSKKEDKDTNEVDKVLVEEPEVIIEQPKKRGRKKKSDTSETDKPKPRGRKKKNGTVTENSDTNAVTW